MFDLGGVVIITPSVARTVIQPDGDVIMVINQKALESPQVIYKHIEKIRRFLSQIKVTRMLMRWLTKAFGIASMSYPLFDLTVTNYYEYISIGFGILLFLFNYLFFLSLKLLLKRKRLF